MRTLRINIACQKLHYDKSQFVSCMFYMWMIITCLSSGRNWHIYFTIYFRQVPFRLISSEWSGCTAMSYTWMFDQCWRISDRHFKLVKKIYSFLWMLIKHSECTFLISLYISAPKIEFEGDEMCSCHVKMSSKCVILNFKEFLFPFWEILVLIFGHYENICTVWAD